jgi:hypothetical protein
MDAITSTTRSTWVNRSSHGVKLGLGFAAGMFLLFQAPLSKSALVGGAVVSFMVFPLDAYCYWIGSTFNPSYPDDGPNQRLNFLWGAPESPRARLQLPIVTGLQMAMYFHLMRLWSGSSNAKLGVFGGLLVPQLKALWGCASAPPFSGGPWAEPLRSQAVLI